MGILDKIWDWLNASPYNIFILIGGIILIDLIIKVLPERRHTNGKDI